jgi:hypothetical protein
LASTSFFGSVPPTNQKTDGVCFEGRTGLLLRTRLRPGLDRSATCVEEELDQLLPPLRRRFPRTPILLRGDAGMATPAVEAKLEAEGLPYVLGIGINRVFKRRVAPGVAQAEARSDRTGRPVFWRTSFRHRARLWPFPSCQPSRGVAMSAADRSPTSIDAIFPAMAR